MRLAMIAVAALTVSGLWEQMTRPTNSQAAASRGVAAYGSQQYAEAVSEFKTATAINPSPQNIFNLGTAQIASGERAAGSATLETAIKHESLRAQALYNRGNSALAANAYDHAIRDYTEALKLAPRDGDAKRNLEIALRRQQSEQQQQQSGGQGQQQNAPSPTPQPSPDQAPEQGQQQEGEADAEALLRSVQQQEQEELARMKRSRGASRRVGW